jgi:POT family proton-dependent oligopeptide transporter
MKEGERPVPLGPGRSRRPSVFSHPAMLYRLVLAEMAERFGYFGVQALLLLYLISEWRVERPAAAMLYGCYTSLAFGGAILGGIAADAYLGAARALLAGGALLLVGYMMLATQSIFPPSMSRDVFLFGLSLIVMGTGLFKPAIATQIGALYPAEDPRRESGFYLFYIGINAGAAVAPLVCGFIAARFGWEIGFVAAGIGTAVGLSPLFMRRAELADVRDSGRGAGARVFYLTLALIVVGVFEVLNNVRYALVVIALLFCFGVSRLFLIFKVKATEEERSHLKAILLLLLAAVVWWTLAQQAGSTLTLFTESWVDLRMGPLNITAAQTQFLPPLFIVLFAPLIAWVFLRLARRGNEPSAPWKFAIGLGSAGLGFLILSLVCLVSPAAPRISLGWLALTYLLQTVGELILAAPGIAVLTKLAPARAKSQVMGLWLFTVAIGNFGGAWIAGQAPIGKVAGLLGYGRLFAMEAALGIGAAVLMAAISPMTQYLMNRAVAPLR